MYIEKRFDPLKFFILLFLSMLLPSHNSSESRSPYTLIALLLLLSCFFKFILFIYFQLFFQKGNPFHVFNYIRLQVFSHFFCIHKDTSFNAHFPHYEHNHYDSFIFKCIHSLLHRKEPIPKQILVLLLKHYALRNFSTLPKHIKQLKLNLLLHLTYVTPPVSTTY